jgi:hypothetical protein
MRLRTRVGAVLAVLGCATTLAMAAPTVAAASEEGGAFFHCQPGSTHGDINHWIIARRVNFFKGSNGGTFTYEAWLERCDQTPYGRPMYRSSAYGAIGIGTVVRMAYMPYSPDRWVGESYRRYPENQQTIAYMPSAWYFGANDTELQTCVDWDGDPGKRQCTWELESDPIPNNF